MAAAADVRLGGWPELLPRHPSRSPAAGDPPIRALDGAELFRRQHRRGYRANLTTGAPGLLFGAARAGGRGDGRPPNPRTRAFRLEWHCDRPARHVRRPRSAADQSAYQLLLPLRTAD